MTGGQKVPRAMEEEVQGLELAQDAHRLGVVSRPKVG